ncbi:MAG: hypothetical protein K2Z81_12195 [Cyanobacteria bacterium]|nr:hypothetical protein [Cyanobacteriota bacterium]
MTHDWRKLLPFFNSIMTYGQSREEARKHFGEKSIHVRSRDEQIAALKARMENERQKKKKKKKN